jgi:hypothetical protein
VFSEPPLSPEERNIVKSYGGWTQFMHSFGLKPWDFDEIDEGKRILEGFVADDKERKVEEEEERKQKQKK